MAERTIRWETSGHVVWIGGSNECLAMAAVAAGRRACESATCVTLTARESDVGSRELKLRHRIVIKGALEPGSRVMALFARLGHAAGDVIWIGGFLEVGNVARGALRWGACISSGGVALHALHTQVSAGERERRLVVIEAGAAPGSCIVATHASLRNAGSDVVRAGGLLKVGEVTTYALSRGGSVVRRGVALRARDRDV